MAMIFVRDDVLEGMRGVGEFVLCYFLVKLDFLLSATLSRGYSHSLAEYKKRPSVPSLTGFVRSMLDVGDMVAALILLVVNVGLLVIAAVVVLDRKGSTWVVVWERSSLPLDTCLCDLGAFAFYDSATTKYIKIQQLMVIIR
jgi:hypothetical protein